ncbi:MAG: alpha-amylase family glycosyl hydrolase [Bacteroidales bacterium]
MKPIIYQLFPRLFGNKRPQTVVGGTLKDNGCGKFNDISSKALKALREFGATHVWYTGIVSHATCTDYSEYGLPASHPLVTKGRAGSPFAIRDYYDVDPDLAEKPARRLDEFIALVQRTHREGLKVIIDFVPNHVARQYQSIAKPTNVLDLGENDDPQFGFRPENDFYYLPGQTFYPPEFVEPFGPDWVLDVDPLSYYETPARVSGNDCMSARPSIYDWYDTVKLNYGYDIFSGQEHYDPMPPLWFKMRDILLFWASLGIDGFRCDMAGMVPVSFWKFAINEVRKKFPQTLFIAEIYEPWRYHNFLEAAGFDYVYDKEGLYNILRDIMQWGHSARRLSEHWKNLQGKDDRMLRFLETHDEIRLASRYFLGDAFKAVPGMLVTACMNMGPVLIYNGQEVGEPAEGATGFSGDDGRSSIFDYTCMPEMQKWVNEGKFDGKFLSESQKQLRNFYVSLLNLCQRQALANGQFYDLMWVNQHHPGPDPDKIFAWIRHNQEEKLLCIANFDTQHTHHFRLYIPIHAYGVMGLDVNDDFTLTPLLLQPSFEFEPFHFKGFIAAYDGIALSVPPSSGSVFILSKRK